VLSIAASEQGEYERPDRPLCVIDIRSADPDLAPHSNFARVASVFGFPSVEYVHYTEFSADKIEAIDPAVLILPGLVSGEGVDAKQMDAAVLAAVEYDAPVVGVCLGHQVLARAHGARLGRSPEWGPTEIRVVRGDPLFDGLPRRPRFFNSESHNYVVQRPIGKMQIIASSENCETQVFRYRGKPWYTFQGHIERGWEVASPEAVLLWKNMFRRWKVIPPQ
jgi:GMP synthase-like glutamine amidotransferase